VQNAGKVGENDSGMSKSLYLVARKRASSNV